MSFLSYLQERGGSAVTPARRLDPGEVLDLVRQSGLRGRGGAGFPTGAKWASGRARPVRDALRRLQRRRGRAGDLQGPCLLRANPYQLLEGVAIAAIAVGATEALHRAQGQRSHRDRATARARSPRSSPPALRRLSPISIVAGPEEYLFGEEKALLEVIEGRGPLPRAPPTAASPRGRPLRHAHVARTRRWSTTPRPSSHIPTSCARPGWFRQLGTIDTPGTMVAPSRRRAPARRLRGRAGHSPCAGSSTAVGGGAAPGRTIKAVFSGVANRRRSAGAVRHAARATRRCRPSARASAPPASSSTTTRPASRASPRLLARFLYVESCGQCPPCKVGLGDRVTRARCAVSPHRTADLERVVSARRSTRRRAIAATCRSRRRS